MKVEIFLDVPSYATKSADCFAYTSISGEPGPLVKRYKITVDVDRPHEGEPLAAEKVEPFEDNEKESIT